MRWTAIGVVLVAACGGDDGGGGGDDDCPGYANIVGGTFARAGAMTTWTMEVEELPATLPFDKTDVSAHVLEYRWSIDLDANSDGVIDLEASMLHYKMNDAVETERPILMGTQQDLWTRMGLGGTISGDVDVSVADNVITFVIDDSEDPLLPMVTSEAQATWTTFVQLGAGLTNRCEDEYRP